MGHDADIAGLSYVHLSNHDSSEFPFWRAHDECEQALTRSPRREVRRICSLGGLGDQLVVEVGVSG
jgi:hypothetical protein